MYDPVEYPFWDVEWCFFCDSYVLRSWFALLSADISYYWFAVTRVCPFGPCSLVEMFMHRLMRQKPMRAQSLRTAILGVDSKPKRIIEIYRVGWSLHHWCIYINMYHIYIYKYRCIHIYLFICLCVYSFVYLFICWCICGCMICTSILVDGSSTSRSPVAAALQAPERQRAVLAWSSHQWNVNDKTEKLSRKEGNVICDC